MTVVVKISHTISWLTVLLCVCSSESHLTNSSDYHGKQTQLVRSGLTHIFWEYIENVNLTSLGISSNCAQSLSYGKYLSDRNNSWILKLMDASGRSPIELTENGYLDTGNYDQCLSLSWIESSKLSTKGQYCLTSIVPSLKSGKYEDNIFVADKIISPSDEMMIKIGLCLPSSCSINDTQITVSKALEVYDWDLIKVDNCQVKRTFIEKLKDASIIQRISFFMWSFIVAAVFTATFIHLTIQKTCKNNVSPKFNVITNFSLLKSFEMLNKISETSRQLPQLTAVVICMQLCVLGIHFAVWPLVTNATTLYATSFKYINLILYAMQMSGDWFTGIIFFYAGIANSLQLWRDIGPDTLFIRTFLSFIKRLLFMSILMGVLVMTQILVPLLSSGPLESIITRYGTGTCASNILYYITFQQTMKLDIEARDICLPHTWSIAVHYHFVPILIVLVHLYKKWPRLGLSVNISLVLIGFSYVGVNFYYSNLGPFAFGKYSTRRDTETWFVKFYLNSAMQLWIYSSALLVTYLIMTCAKSSKLIQIFKNKSAIKLWVTGILLTVWPVIWNEYLIQYETRSLVAIYAVLYRILSGFLFSCFTLRNGEHLKSFFRPKLNVKQGEECLDANYNLVSEKLQRENQITIEKNNQPKMRPKKLEDFIANLTANSFCRALSIILDLAFLIHVPILTWHYSEMRWPVVTFSGLFYDYLWLFVFSILGGFLLFLLVVGPMKVFLASLEQHKRQKKQNVIRMY